MKTRRIIGPLLAVSLLGEGAAVSGTLHAAGLAGPEPPTLSTAVAPAPDRPTLAGLRTQMPAAPLARAPDWRISGGQEWARLGEGRSLAYAGDVNGDGYDDVIIGAPNHSNGQTQEGRAYVLYGSRYGLGNFADWEIECNVAFAKCGISVGTAGDVNNDTYDDIIVGAGYGAGGSAFVWLGSPFGLGGDGTPAGADWQATGTSGIGLGASVATAGDVNNDTYDDIIVSAQGYSNPEDREGAVFVWYGSASGLGDPGTPSNADWRAEGNLAGLYLGEAATAGNVNGDAYDDIIVGTPYRDSANNTDEGAAFVWYGPLSGVGNPTNADWRVYSNLARGSSQWAYFGQDVGTAGDVNNDTYDDVIIGAPGYWDPSNMWGTYNAGAAFVWYGGEGGLGADGTAGGRLDNTNADWWQTGPGAYAKFGQSVAAAGDVDGDGWDDVVIGASGYDPSASALSQGRIYVYPGSFVGLGSSPLWVADGERTGDRFGTRVRGAGDINGGFSDIIASAPYFEQNASLENEGAVYAFLSGYAIIVEDELRKPVAGADVYVNGQRRGATNAEGKLRTFLQVGDQIIAAAPRAEAGTLKGGHNQDATQNWAYRTYLTSLDVPVTGAPAPYVVPTTSADQVLTVKTDNTLIGFNLLVHVEWDATPAYLAQLGQGFERASAYLYDATDGQMLFERITIEDATGGRNHDYLVKPDNVFRARAHTRGLTVTQLRVEVGRNTAGETGRASWAESAGFSTLIHEFGHYGLDLRDSYFYTATVDFGFGPTVSHLPGHCTSADIHSNTLAATNATLMDYHYNATEFSMQGVPGLWSASCRQTYQWQRNHESDWETIVSRFDGPKWELKTPATYSTVVPGPDAIPVPGWSSVTISDTNTGICATPPTVTLLLNAGGVLTPQLGTDVILKKAGGQVLHQGETDAAGRIEIVGASNGDIVEGEYLDVPFNMLRGRAVISCTELPLSSGLTVHPNPFGPGAPQETGELTATLEPAPFWFDVGIWPSSALTEAIVTVAPSVGLTGTPAITLYQSGAAAGVGLTAIYDTESNLVTGTAPLDAALPTEGLVEVVATDTLSNTVDRFVRFGMNMASSTEETQVWSEDGKAELYVPAGALPPGGAVSIAPAGAPGAAPDDLVPLSPPYAVRTTGGAEFDGGAVLHLYASGGRGWAKNTAPTTAAVYHWNGDDWEALESLARVDYGFASASIGGEGLYWLLAERNKHVYLPLVLRDG